MKNPLLAQLDKIAEALHGEKKFASELSVLQAIYRITSLSKRALRVCSWGKARNPVQSHHYRSSCGQDVLLTAGEFESWAAQYCPYCGGKIEYRRKK